MQLKKFMKKENIPIEKAANELGFSYEDVRRYINEKVIPRPKRLVAIQIWSNGEVTPNDFYELANDNELPDVTA